MYLNRGENEYKKKLSLNWNRYWWEMDTEFFFKRKSLFLCRARSFRKAARRIQIGKYINLGWGRYLAGSL